MRFRAATVGEFIEQQTTNLSAGGIFIRSKSPLPRGTLMVFEFQLQDGASLIKGVGRVVWVRRTDSPTGEPPGMGMKFIRIDPESRETFEALMAAKDGSGGQASDGQIAPESVRSWRRRPADGCTAGEWSAATSGWKTACATSAPPRP